MTPNRPGPVRFDRDPGTGTAVVGATPRLSWKLAAGTARSAELELTDAEGTTVRPVDGPDQVLVPWPFAPLTSRARGSVRVRVAAGEG